MNPCDTGLNHRIARWPQRRKPRGRQGISYRNQPGKLCLDERLSLKTALARGFVRTERKCRYQENSSKHSNRFHAFILFRTHCIRQSKSAQRGARTRRLEPAQPGGISGNNGREKRRPAARPRPAAACEARQSPGLQTRRSETASACHPRALAVRWTERRRRPPPKTTGPFTRPGDGFCKVHEITPAFILECECICARSFFPCERLRRTLQRVYGFGFYRSPFPEASPE